MAIPSSTSLVYGGGDSTTKGRRRPPSSQAERDRRKAFGVKYGNIMRQIKLDRERDGQ